MTPLAVMPIWADAVECRACRILMYRDCWTIELSVYGHSVARKEVASIEDALELANQCRPLCLKPTGRES